MTKRTKRTKEKTLLSVDRRENLGDQREDHGDQREDLGDQTNDLGVLVIKGKTSMTLRPQCEAQPAAQKA